MRASRREFLIAGAAGALGVGLAASCTPAPAPVGPAPGCPTGPLVVGPSVLPAPGSVGLMDEALFQARTTEYLQLATDALRPDDTASVIAHLLRGRRDPDFVWDPSQVGTGIVRTDPYRDTDDFELMYQQWVLRLGRGVLPEAAIAAIEDKIANARYRYDDPIPPGEVDDKWFWSENHRIMFAVDEYLGGLAVPDRVFGFTGLTGAQHAERARPVLIDWIRERGKFGFSEWHSNTYMKFVYAPLLTLVQWADDPELLALGAAATDICLFDLATHTFRGVYGVTHGRGYKAAKTTGIAESTFSTAKFLFDTTDSGYSNTTDHGVLFLCGNDRYRLPEVIRRAARHEGPVRIRERHGVHVDPHEPWSPDPQGAYGYDYTVENLPFWWSHGALTTWQFVPPTLEACNRWNLWDSELFQKFSAVKQFSGIDPTVAQLAVRELAPFAAAAVVRRGPAPARGVVAEPAVRPLPTDAPDEPVRCRPPPHGPIGPGASGRSVPVPGRPPHRRSGPSGLAALVRLGGALEARGPALGPDVDVPGPGRPVLGRRLRLGRRHHGLGRPGRRPADPPVPG